MREVDVVYFFEHVARELDIACAVKYLLESRHGLSMEITSFSMDREGILKRHEPDVVAVPYCYSANDSGLSDILQAWPHANYLNLAFEQIFGKANEVLKIPRDSLAKEHVLHHAWGDPHAALLREHGVPQENIVVNGNPSYTLYRPPYSAFFETKAELAHRHGLCVSKRWVFVPENYGMAFYSDDVMRWIAQQYIQRGFDEGLAYRYRQFAQASLEAAIQWWHRAAQLGSVELIVRPRPATRLQSFVAAYHNTAGDTPQCLHIIKDGSVREWIMASDVVISSYSTSLIEAAVAGKPIHMLMPIPFPDFLQQDWYEMVPKIETSSQFAEVVTASGLDITYRELRAWAEQSMMSHGDAIANLANLLALMRLRKKSLPSPPCACGLPTPGRERPPTWRRGLRRIRQALARAVRRSNGYPQEGNGQDRISASDVALRTARWAKLLGPTLVSSQEQSDP